MTPPYIVDNGGAVVTGAASGTGETLSMALAARRSHLALIDRAAGGLLRAAENLRTHHPALQVSSHPFDLSRTAQIPALEQEVLGAHGRVSLLINNAGIALGGTFEQVQSVNFRAVVAMCRAFLPPFRSSLGSQIVNISSLYGSVGPSKQRAYSASKFAVRDFSEVLRHELAPSGIGVTVVHPGGVRTNSSNNAAVDAQHQ
ncbi:MAG: Short-chain dehydrogenase/reductase [Deinococcus sp.]|nr:Short-chain dehydrogenase/reductase [Deinococcus sp.]